VLHFLKKGAKRKAAPGGKIYNLGYNSTRKEKEFFCAAEEEANILTVTSRCLVLQ
jgi:hypothetical protein